MPDIADLLGQLDIPADELARIAEQAKSNPMAAMALLQKHLTPEMMQQLLGFFLSNPGAFAAVAEQAGIETEQLDQLRDQLGGSANA